ncbi:CHROMATIN MODIFICATION-RELATED PROTEIN EAF1 A-RELATED [Salix purpurea]|uniref:CHROMATIN MODIFICATION-RELATED PROTEIN EAF1 A-RELATED n=1 Tax=Salix purpurea TaxID=77065 RepID=A0A9Q0V2G9_SALPP|nr:CHROMATIN MODIFICATION-RELATED PROTEIN EAF1 A-RELATED [Salix purpurea]
MKQLQDNAFDSMVQMTGSIPSPALSQMSNMSNTKRFIKLIGGRERGRKNKSMKMSAGQPGFGSPWSLFEDQALVVLVHDMGPNYNFHFSDGEASPSIGNLTRMQYLTIGIHASSGELPKELGMLTDLKVL